MSEILAALQNMDWSFDTRSNAKGLHDIHPYPAKFIPEIPFQLINVLGVPENTCILDPFCGSGTTLVAAQTMGFESIGIDLNPIACLISEVKTTDSPANLMELATEVVKQATSAKHNLSDVAHIPNLNHWFTEEVQLAVLGLKKGILEIHTEQARRTLMLCLSSILVRVSNQDSDTRYAAVENNTTIQQVYKLFISTVNKLITAKENLVYKKESVSIINQDILQVKPTSFKKKVGLIITSPPYPNAYEYWLYHKYRMFWLDFDPLAVKEREIGARAHFFKKNHHTKEDFFHQMCGTLKLVKQVLVTDGYAAFVVGRSKIHGEIVDNSVIIKNAAEASSLHYVGKITRQIKSSRKSFNLSHAKIKEEQIVILQNRHV